MTEKEPVIVDGVDVSGCEDYGYRGKAGYWCHNYDEPCTDYPNCNFKQLAHKTQECEHWKHQAELGSDTTDRFAKQLEEKEQDCEELKSQLTSLSYADTICALEIDLEHKTRECEELKKANIHIDNDRMVKSKKLEKIRDYIYANTNFDKDDSIQSKTAGYDILQIISGVE